MMNYYPILFLVGLSLSSCVSKKTLQMVQADHQRLSDSLAQLRYEQDTLYDALAFERGANYALLITQNKLQDRLDALQENIDQLSNNASSAQQSLNNNLSKKEEELARRQEQLNEIKALLTRDEERLAALAADLRSNFNNIGVTEDWEAVVTNNELRLSLGEENLFRRNSTSAITTTGENLLQTIANILGQYPEMEILAIGHTDNKPVNRQGLDNWQYSALRAVSIVKYLTGEGELGANRVTVAAKSEYAPLESNETTEGQKRNRRIDLIISIRRTDLQRNIRSIIQP